MATKENKPATKKELKALFKDVAKHHTDQLTRKTRELKDDLTTIHKLHTNNLAAEIDSVKELHAETHAETIERFDDLEAKIDTLLLDQRLARLERKVFGKATKIIGGSRR